MLSRTAPQSGEWALLLEGLCRVLLGEVVPPRSPQEPELVQVTQLELRPGSPAPASTPSPTPAWQLPVRNGGTPFGNGTDGSPASEGPLSIQGSGAGQPSGDSASVHELGRQLRSTARAFLLQLQRRCVIYSSSILL